MSQGIEWPDDMRPTIARLERKWKIQRDNRRVTARDRELSDEARAERGADFARQVAELEQVPLTERVPEYVLRYDDAGNVVGVTRPSEP